ncbi:hypothetical protein MKY98_05315 [Paenibacillus sp. FSL M8-0228]|nr:MULTISPECIES: hypothetical protein [Paenibacillus]ODB58565.1 hypothetical protein A7311_12590 [Paenibacillus polymyxa]UMY55859.1 hypothetical protein MLD56_05285 [Paenibacillus peoriae]
MFVWKTPLHGRGAPAYVNQMSMMPIYHENIDAWLKNHIVPIVVLNFVTVTHERQMKKIAGDDKLLRQMIAAMDEGFRVLEALRYPLTPAAQASSSKAQKSVEFPNRLLRFLC